MWQMNIISTLKGMKCSFVLKRLSNLLKDPNYILVIIWGISIFSCCFLLKACSWVSGPSREFICKKLLLQSLLASITASRHLDSEHSRFGLHIINCVKLVNLKYNSKLLLELSSVQYRTNSAPRIKPTVKYSKHYIHIIL